MARQLTLDAARCSTSRCAFPGRLGALSAVLSTRRMSRRGLRTPRASNSLQDLIPRIVEEIPARLPRPDQFRMVEVDRDALMQLIFPEGSSDFLQLSWVVLLFGAVLFAVLFEISVLAVKIFNPDDDTPAGPGGRSMASMASIDLPDEEEKVVMPDPTIATSPPQETIERERAVLKPYIKAERYRGLSWLAAITILSIWCTGVLNKENPLAP